MRTGAGQQPRWVLRGFDRGGSMVVFSGLSVSGRRVSAVALVTLLLAASCGGPQSMTTMTKAVRKAFPEVRQISPETLEEWLAGPTPPRLLDVRKAEEFAVSHLPGASLATDLETARKVLKGEPKDRPVVVYCSVGYRSSSLGKDLAAEGYTQVYNLEGSIFEWANSGRAVERDGQTVREVHPYGAPWGRLLEKELRWKPRETSP